MTIRLSTGVQNALAGKSVELVTNGTFDSAKTGWTDVTAVSAYTSGAVDGRSNTLKVNGSAGYTHQAIATKIGHLYKISFYHDATAGNGYVYAGTSAGASTNYTSGNLATTGSWTLVTSYFLATGTTTYISLGTDGTGDHYYDSVSLVNMSASLKECFRGGNFKIYSGTQPADPDDVPTGTLLVTIQNGASGITWGDATNGVIAKTVGETWSGTVVAAGTAGYFRLMTAGDLGTDNETDFRIDGACGTSGSDMNFSSLVFSVGAVQTLTDYELEVPMQA